MFIEVEYGRRKNPQKGDIRRREEKRDNERVRYKWKVRYETREI